MELKVDTHCMYYMRGGKGCGDEFDSLHQGVCKNIILDDVGFSLIGLGKCDVGLESNLLITSIEYAGNEIKLCQDNAGNTGYWMSSDEISQTIRSLALSRIIEKVTLGTAGSKYRLYVDNSKRTIVRNTRLSNKRIQRLSYLYEVVEAKRPKEETVLQTLDRWNIQLMRGRLITSSSMTSEKYIEIPAETVLAAIENSDNMAQVYRKRI